MLRLNMGRPAEPPAASPGFHLAQAPGGWQPLDADPFATGPVQAQGAPPGQGGSGAGWSSLDFDPFGGAVAPTPGSIHGVANASAGSPRTQAGAAWQDEPGYFPGVFGTGTSRLVETQEPAPDPPPMVSRTGTPAGRPAPWTGPLDAAGRAFGAYWGLPPPGPSWAERAAQAIDAAPPGTGRVPDLDPTGPAAVDATRRQVMATPYRPPSGDGTSLTNPTPGVVSFDPDSGDAFGGHASNMALIQASFVPLNSQENLKKRIMIYAADLGVPPDRFFTDSRGNVKYVDRRGQVFSVAPTVGGGDLWNAPVDMAQRVTTQGAANFAPGAVMLGAGTAAMATGPENYGPAGIALAGAAGFVGDVAAQAAGNKFAEMSGYRPQVSGGGPDISWGHAAFTGLEMMGYEALARILPAALNGLFPNALGNNPYRLTGLQAQDLARVLEHDIRHNGGEILKRARVADELGLPLSPANLLQMTKEVGTTGTSSDMVNLRTRLYNLFATKEATLAAGGNTKRGAKAAQYLREHYVHRARVAFPDAVQRLLDRISPVQSPMRGFEEFKRAADRVENFLERRRLEAGRQAGWGPLFQSGAMANPVPAIRMVEQRLANAAGAIRQEMARLRRELVDVEQVTHLGRTTPREVPVTNFQRLHQVRLGLERRMDELRGGRQSAEATELRNELEGIHDLLRGQLNQNPLYFTGDRAYQEASAVLNDVRRGLNPLLKRDPLHQERLGGALADSGPSTIQAARRVFEEAGELEAWNAHTRAYLETSLRGAGGGAGMMGGAGSGYDVGLRFANDIAGQPKARAGLLEMVATPSERELLDGLVDAGFAIEQAGRGLEKSAAELIRPDPRSLNGGGGLRLAEKATGLLTPIQTMVRQGRGFQEWRDMRGARQMAFETTMPAGKNYKEMTDTMVPLAGRSGEVLERGIFAAAPLIQEQTQAIPRLSPKWLMELAAPYLIRPPSVQPTAPDLRPPPGRLQQLLDATLGPSP